MEPETLLNCGKANRRLHRLVGDKQVWKSLLKGVEDFTEEGLEGLVKFVGAKGSSEMKTEAKEGSHCSNLQESLFSIFFCFEISLLDLKAFSFHFSFSISMYFHFTFHSRKE